MRGSKILVIEDELITAESIRESLGRAGYAVTGVATTADEAFALVREDPPDLSLVDIRIRGGTDGIEVARRLAADFDIPVIFLTAYSDNDVVSRARDSLSYGYLLKPFEDRELYSNIEIAIHKHRADRAVRESEARLRESNEKLRATVIGIAAAMAVAVETRDPYTAGHQRRVAELAAAMARRLDLPGDTIDGIRIAASIHDIGKLGVPAELLVKPTRLTALELELIKTHARAGYDILKNIDFPWPIAETVYQHHERIDGSGYPRGLKGDDILTEARIIAVADAVEAIASHRPYRPALGIDAAVAELGASRGKLFDPGIVDACVSLLKTGFGFTTETGNEAAGCGPMEGGNEET
ncbi:MAG TPA: response regulator [Spirochaetota bacterium]|nr:response regulator [Spirochaetota bacterium]HPC41144.1 response regulator [Spirochaetota bacterium]HPL15565.1 response regulator [Spirochaetota bacterium]HQF07064.1 response regulator [Spirochaetota bacterium]HQH95801.1 response regulator [Spirochaetota bacterium]